MSLKLLVETLLFPPGIVIVLGLFVYFVADIRPRLLARVFLFSTAVLWIFSIPATTDWMTLELQKDFPNMETIPTDADSIIVLAGGQVEGLNEYGDKLRLGDDAYERVRYAAHLAKVSGLPIIATGGKVFPHKRANSSLIKQLLKDEFKVDNVIEEDRSQSTFENALYTSAVLQKHDFAHPILVTHAWHMARSVEAFDYFGVEVSPAPTARFTENNVAHGVEAWLPKGSGMYHSTEMLHEFVGRLYYRLKYYSEPPQRFVEEI